MVTPAPVRGWHAVVEAGDPATRDRLLADLLATDVVFRSPAVHAPQEGRDLTTAYLRAAMAVLGPTLSYERQLLGEQSACLEFRADLDGVQVHGVDLLRWDDSDRLVEFTVMVRPMRGLTTLVELMTSQLAASSHGRPGSRE
ncbi:MAG: nuclear transport factor 2 family protein [Actinomycetota bacterium]|nr:nuclear transport factor 2 family protein [Actinomycetota bacterium]